MTFLYVDSERHSLVQYKRERKLFPSGSVNSVTKASVNVMSWLLCWYFLQVIGVHHCYLKGYLDNPKEKLSGRFWLTCIKL